MQTWKRRAVGYLLFVVGALLVTALGYQWGMWVWEDRPRTYIQSLQFTVEMFTTTGFGGDSPWQTAPMQTYILVTDLLGMGILVGALPVFVGPLVDNALSTAAPQELDTALEDHVVICSYTARVKELITELDAHDVPYVIVEGDRDRANELHEEGHRVIRANPESTGGLEAAGLPDARALFADVSDQVDASIVLAARELSDDLPIVSVVEDPDRAKYHRLAGADHVLSPRELLGESLAQKATTALRLSVDDAAQISEDVRLAEISIRHGSELAGTTLAGSEIRDRTGVNVLGTWHRGEFDAAPDPDAPLDAGTVLLVSGRPGQLDRLVELSQSTVRAFETGETIVIGYGEVGRTVERELQAAGIDHTIVDRDDLAAVDVVGDATETETLVEAGVEDAGTVVLALPDDTTTEFATLVVRDLAPATEIIARVEKNANVSKTYRAGADYVLSLATVTGRMAASYLLEDRNVLSIDQQVEVTRVPAAGLVGRTIQEANIREETGCTVIAIARNGEVTTDVGPDTEIGAEDELVIGGTDEGIRTFERQFT